MQEIILCVCVGMFQDLTVCVFIFWAWIIHSICELVCFSLNKPQFHITKTRVFPLNTLYSKCGGTLKKKIYMTENFLASSGKSFNLKMGAMCACWKSNYFHDMAECYREPDWELAAKRGFHLFPKWFFMCKSVSLYMMLSRKLGLLTFRFN